MKRIKQIILLILISFNMRIAIVSISANLYTIQESLVLNNQEGGLLTSVPLIFMGIIALFVNYVQKNLGQKWGIGIFLFLLGIATVLRIYIDEYFYLLATTALSGLCIAIVGPLISGYIKMYFPDMASPMVAVYTTTMGLGQIFVSIASNRLVSEGRSWQFSIGVWGFITLISAMIWLLLGPSEQEAEIENVPVARSQTMMKAYQDISVAAMWRNPLLWQLIVLYSSQAGLNYSFSTWLQPYLVSKNHSVEFGGFIVSLLTFSYTCSNLIVAYLAGKPGRIKLWVQICGIMIGLGGLILLAGSHNELFVQIGVFMIGFGGTGIFNITLIIPIRIAHSAQEASLMTSSMQTVGYAVAAIVPLLLGWIIDMTTFFDGLIYLAFIAMAFIVFFSFSPVVLQANKNH